MDLELVGFIGCSRWVVAVAHRWLWMLVCIPVTVRYLTGALRTIERCAHRFEFEIIPARAKKLRSRLKFNCGSRSLASVPLTLTSEPHNYTLHTLEVQFLRSLVPKNSVLLHLATIQTR